MWNSKGKGLEMRTLMMSLRNSNGVFATREKTVKRRAVKDEVKEMVETEIDREFYAKVRLLRLLLGLRLKATGDF